MLSSAQIDTINKHLDGRFALDTLWLYGSEAIGSAGPFSDIDLAGLFRSRPSALDLLEARDALGALLGRHIDLVDLDRAFPSSRCRCCGMAACSSTPIQDGAIRQSAMR